MRILFNKVAGNYRHCNKAHNDCDEPKRILMSQLEQMKPKGRSGFNAESKQANYYSSTNADDQRLE